jgi:hypothetical protein
MGNNLAFGWEESVVSSALERGLPFKPQLSLPCHMARVLLFISFYRLHLDTDPRGMT